MTNAAFNLAQVAKRSNWYDHLSDVERAMRQAADDWAIRQDYGWEGDDGGEWGPNPLQPGETVMEGDWEETLGLALPEDFTAGDAYVYELMDTIGKYKHDPVLMAHMVALRAADYLGNVGHDATVAIRSQLRTSYAVEHANA
jgi:hypothetical protein